MPTYPDWSLGLSSELCDWYIFPCRQLTAELQEELNYQMEYARAQEDERKWFEQTLSDLRVGLAYRRTKVAKGVIDARELNEMIENIKSVQARLSWLSRRNWAVRYNNLLAQKTGHLTAAQEHHNQVRNCENSCLTCRYNSEAKECQSILGQRERVGDFRGNVVMIPGNNCN